MVNTPTKGPNILDVFITNRPSLVETCDTISGISDHEAVLVSSVVANLSHPSERIIYLWAQADFNTIQSNMHTFCDNFLSTFSTSAAVDALWDKFLSICNTCLDSVLTKLTSSKCKHPWINNYIKRLTHRKQRAYNQARSSNLPASWSKYYDLKRQCQRECCTVFNRYVSNLVDPRKNTITKCLWSFIKSKRQDHVGISTLKHQGETFVDVADKANLLVDYFSSVFTSEDTTHFPTLPTAPTPSISPIGRCISVIAKHSTA